MQEDDTALIEASKNGEIDVVEHLLAHKADVNAKKKVSTLHALF